MLLADETGGILGQRGADHGWRALYALIQVEETELGALRVVLPNEAGTSACRCYRWS